MAATATPARAGVRRPRAAVAKRDPAGMQRRILDAACAEFATHGFGGARVERISRRAGTVDRMLYYYFGSKDGLFRAVLEDTYEQLGAAEQKLELSGVDAVEGMRQLIAFTWNYYVAHPEFIRLLNSENLHRGEHVKKSRRVKALSFPLLSAAFGGRERTKAEALASQDLMASLVRASGSTRT